MEKLTSTTDFVLERTEDLEMANLELYKEELINILNHANFLSQTLNISMFVPAKLVDGEWVVLEEPEQYLGALEWAIGEDYDNALEYKEAEEKVIFEGFEVCNRNEELDCIVNGDFHLSTNFKYEKTIEDLVKYNLTLTATAKKQIWL